VGELVLLHHVSWHDWWRLLASPFEDVVEAMVLSYGLRQAFALGLFAAMRTGSGFR
jgi:hypothetical protein